MNKKEKLLLLSCCAPCSVGVISDLHEKGIDFTVLFYNPNIQPESEYIRRRDENAHVCQKFGVPFKELEYDPETWKCATKGLENEPEKGQRCDMCFYLRLKKACTYAKENGYTKVSSVLGISRWKDFDQVCRAGEKAAKETGIPYDSTNWRKNGGLEKSERLAKEMNLYRQSYCGCKPKK
ncbi:MAG: epoxyqueuosine reductase QueH [Alphaproteobacteria bacterium]|nr:epoxyqueuosine reductase QueH [Alphaproteobacteria bacterium]